MFYLQHPAYNLLYALYIFANLIKGNELHTQKRKYCHGPTDYVCF